MIWRARALIFSGRPDPTWVLSPDDEEALVTAWSRLPPAGPADAAPPPTLGYRGVKVVADDGRTWVASGGIVTLTAGGESTVRRDEARTVERLVFATAPADLLPFGTGPG